MQLLHTGVAVSGPFEIDPSAEVFLAHDITSFKI